MYFLLTCPSCYQGGTVPTVPLSVIGLDGTAIQEQLTYLPINSSHSTTAAPYYTGPCGGPPCYGSEVRVELQRWEVCLYTSSSANETITLTCTQLGTNSQLNTQQVTVPDLGPRGSVDYIAVYKIAS